MDTTARFQARTVILRAWGGWGFALVACLAALALHGCDRTDGLPPPSGIPSDPESVVNAAIYFTDDVSGDIDKAWLSVSKITAFSPSHGEITLISYTPSRIFNLTNLHHAGVRLGAISMPDLGIVGIPEYVGMPLDTTTIRTYVQPHLSVTRAGSATPQIVTLDMATPYIEFSLANWVHQTGVLVLNFGLSNSRWQGNMVTPVPRLADDRDMHQWSQRRDHFQGQVVESAAATDAQGHPMTLLTVQTVYHGPRGDIHASRELAVYRDQTAFIHATNTRWQPKVGDVIFIASLADDPVPKPEGSRFVAERIGDVQSMAPYKEVTGRISALDLTAGTGTLDIYSSTDTTLQDSVTLSGLTTSRLIRGRVNDLALGRVVTVYLADHDTPRAVFATAIQGGLTAIAQAERDYDASYSSVFGRIVHFVPETHTATVLVDQVSNVANVVAGWPARFDLSMVHFSGGAITCLGDGVFIRIKGPVDGNGFMRPMTVETTGHCRRPGSTSPAPTVPATGFGQIGGLVTRVGTGSFEMNVHGADHVSAPKTLTVEYDSSTRFKYMAQGDLRPTLFVEIKGTLSANPARIQAVEIATGS